MDIHSILPPSSAHIWGADKGCTGWVVMAQKYPEPEDGNEDTANGTASHKCGEQLIRAGIGWETKSALSLGSAAPNGVVVTNEMIECAEIYATDVLETYRNMKDRQRVKIGVEDTIAINRVNNVCFGTADSWMYDVVANILYIWDYKYGHRFVEVFENLQGVCYAAGLIDKLKLPDDCTVVFRIVQPRSYSSQGPIREWRVKMKQLFGLFGQLAMKAVQSLDPTAAKLQTGPHCRDCYPRFACPAALEAGVGLYEVAMKPTTHQLSNGALGLQLSIIKRAIKQLESMEKAFEGQIEAKVKSGKAVPGWGVEQTVGREEWIKPVSEVIAMGRMMNINIEKPGAITPNQARKLGIPDVILMEYSGRTKKGLKVVEDNGLKARKAFSYNESNIIKE